MVAIAAGMLFASVLHGNRAVAGTPVIVAFGDSLTEGVVSAPLTQALVNIPYAYPARLADVLRARYADQADIVVLNEGKAGEFAVEMLKQVFPDRQVIGLPSTAILTGGGSFHCISQQEPA